MTQRSTADPENRLRSSLSIDEAASKHSSVATLEARYQDSFGSNRRSLKRRLDILEVLRERDGAAEVTTIYRALLNIDEPITMTQLYRTLQALETEGFVTWKWLLDDKRPRRGYVFETGAT